jgi:hypothetical protein
LALSGALSANAMTDACHAQSTRGTVAVVELYTSEGCDSCPPADRWLSAIDLPSDVVIPLAFHVDYWDRLGWKDRFADSRYTTRQHAQMQRQQSAYVYTPQVLMQGRDFRPWGVRGEPAQAAKPINARPARAEVRLDVDRVGGAAVVDVNVVVTEPRERARSEVMIALVQNGLASSVTAGENAGKRLSHDHVVREWQDAGRVDGDGMLQRRVTLPLPADDGPLSIVALVEDRASGDILQALQVPLAKCAGR